MPLPELIRALLDPASYPGRPGSVELLQTHISYLFFTPSHVYKIKKPVDFGFLDFTTLEKRLYYCTEEVRLNKRLAPRVYEGVVPVTRFGGAFAMEGRGDPVEYAVKMKRLDEKNILEARLEREDADEKTVKRVARAIASFHEKAETNKNISAYGVPSAIGKNISENFAQTADFIGDTVSERIYDGVKAYAEGFLEKNEGLFLSRAQNGFIRDCHGDIHCEHISINEEIDIIDCIEFNERFRYSDIAADTAFLSMDLDFHNRHDLARVLDDEYFKAVADGQGSGLLDFYRCYRAYVRGKVEGFMAREAEVGERERLKAFLRARYHFHLAGQYAGGGFKPLMIAVFGLSGTGKTTVSNAFAGNFGMKVFSSDAVRKELAGIPPGQKRAEEYGAGIYSEEFTERTYGALLEKGAACLRAGRSAVLDATFSKRRQRRAAQEIARGCGADFYLIECAAEDSDVRRRMLKREKEETADRAVSDADWEIYLEQKKSFEPAEGAHLKLDAGVPAAENAAEMARKIFG